MSDLSRRSEAPGRTPSGLVRSWAQTLATHAVLTVTAMVGLVLAVGLTMASSSIYGAVVDNDGIAALDQPTLDQAVQQRTETNVQIVRGSPTCRPAGPRCSQWPRWPVRSPWG
jgi:hypothetical protein